MYTEPASHAHSGKTDGGTSSSAMIQRRGDCEEGGTVIIEPRLPNRTEIEAWVKRCSYNVTKK